MKRGKSLLMASEPPKIKLSSVSKKLLIAKILILCCHVSAPAPTNASRAKKPINMLKKDKDINTVKIMLPDSASLKV